MAYLPAIGTAPAADTRSTRQQGLAIGLACIPRNAHAHNTRRPLNGRRGRRIRASAPFRPSGFSRGETVSVFRVLMRVSRGHFGIRVIGLLATIIDHNQVRTALSDRHHFLLVLVRIQVGPPNKSKKPSWGFFNFGALREASESTALTYS